MLVVIKNLSSTAVVACSNAEHIGYRGVGITISIKVLNLEILDLLSYSLLLALNMAFTIVKS